MLEELKEIKSTKKELREFGLTIGIFFLILGGIALWRGKDIYLYFLIIAGFFLISGIYFYSILRPLQRVWMSLAVIMGFFMSRVILTILFYLVITPLGLIAKLFGKDILDEKIDKNAGSYWQIRGDGQKPKEAYEKQF